MEVPRPLNTVKGQGPALGAWPTLWGFRKGQVGGLLLSSPHLAQAGRRKQAVGDRARKPEEPTTAPPETGQAQGCQTL